MRLYVIKGCYKEKRALALQSDFIYRHQERRLWRTSSTQVIQHRVSAREHGNTFCFDRHFVVSVNRRHTKRWEPRSSVVMDARLGDVRCNTRSALWASGFRPSDNRESWRLRYCVLAVYQNKTKQNGDRSRNRKQIVSVAVFPWSVVYNLSYVVWSFAFKRLQ